LRKIERKWRDGWLEDENVLLTEKWKKGEHCARKFGEGRSEKRKIFSRVGRGE
jgi:hypothetical protein